MEGGKWRKQNEGRGAGSAGGNTSNLESTDSRERAEHLDRRDRDRGGHLLKCYWYKNSVGLSKSETTAVRNSWLFRDANL